ncbi:MAG: hypothetical protein ACRETY_08985 [Steroidobacteraceae bacterium]
MRNIFHEIFARYLATGHHAFETSPRELWPSETFEFQLQLGRGGAGLASEPSQRRVAQHEREPAN